MPTLHYTVFGLTFRSELPIPEWAAFQLADAPADVTITLAPPSQDVARMPRGRVASSEAYRLVIPDTACFEVRNGSEVLVTPAPSGGAGEMRLFLLGAVLGAIAYQRQLLFLHASAVLTSAGAVAFCGPTGAGKSTLVAHLAGTGAFLSDDLCRIDLAKERPAIFPATPRLKLWKDALPDLKLDPLSLQRDHRRADKFHVEVEPASPHESVPLAGIYLLEWGKLELTRLTGIETVRQVVKTASYQPELIEPMNQAAGHWMRCATLLSRIPAFRFSRPRDKAAMTTATGRLREHAAAALGVVW